MNTKNPSLRKIETNVKANLQLLGRDWSYDLKA